MFPYFWLFLISFLVSAPHQSRADAAVLQPFYAELRQPLAEMAVAMEILDPRETRFIFTKPEEFHFDLYMVRNRYERYRDFPPLSDAFSLPNRSYANELLVFNRSYLKFLETRLPFDPQRGVEIRGIIRETNQLYKVWDAIRDADCEYYYVTVRREALERLRCLLGDEDYYSQRYPPHVPVWHFIEIH